MELFSVISSCNATGCLASNKDNFRVWIRWWSCYGRRHTNIHRPQWFAIFTEQSFDLIFLIQAGHAGWVWFVQFGKHQILGFWIRLSQERPMFVTTTFSYIDLYKKNGAGGRPIRCQSSFTQDLQGGDPSSEWARKKPKSFVCSQSPAEVVSSCKLHSLADVPLVLLVKKPMDLMGQSLSQLHFTFQMETRSCFLGVSRWNHWLLGTGTRSNFRVPLRQRSWHPGNLPNTSVSSLEQARLSYSYNIQQGFRGDCDTLWQSFWVGTGWQALTTFVQHYLGQHAVELGLEPW